MFPLYLFLGKRLLFWVHFLFVYSEVGWSEHIYSHWGKWLSLGSLVWPRRNNHPLQARCLRCPMLVKYILLCSTLEMQTSHHVVKPLMSRCFGHFNPNNYSSGRKFWIETGGGERDKHSLGIRAVEGGNQINIGPWALLARKRVTEVVMTRKDLSILWVFGGGFSGSEDPRKTSLGEAMIIYQLCIWTSCGDLVVMFLARKLLIIKMLANFREGQVNPILYNLN